MLSYAIRRCPKVYSIPENFRAYEFSFYPNPVKNSLTFKGENLNKIKSLSMYDIIGKCILEMNTEVNQSLVTDEIKLDCTAFPAGIYFLRIKGDDVNKTFKIIKQ